MPNIVYTIKHVYSDGLQIGGDDIPLYVANKTFHRYIDYIDPENYKNLDYTIFTVKNA